MAMFPTIEQAIDDVLLTLRAKSPQTQRTYRTGLRVLGEFLTDIGLSIDSKTTEHLQTDCLAQFYLWLIDKYGRTRTSTVNTYMSAARSLLRYLARNDLCPQISLERAVEQSRAVTVKNIYRAPRIDGNLALLVDFATGIPLPKAGTDSAQLRLRILRDRALLHTVYCTGMRRDEVVGLNRRDIDDGHKSEAIITGKGGRERVVFFDRETLDHVGRYLAERNDRYQPLFIRHHGRSSNPGRSGDNLRLSSQSLWATVKRYAKAAGLDVTTHDFRHNKATTLLNRGANLSEVQDLLGHASPATTKLIYAHYEVGKLREAFHKYSQSVAEAVDSKPDSHQAR